MRVTLAVGLHYVHGDSLGYQLKFRDKLKCIPRLIMNDFISKGMEWYTLKLKSLLYANPDVEWCLPLDRFNIMNNPPLSSE